jgi:O-antigen/teichoic acid export membrane protein
MMSNAIFGQVLFPSYARMQDDKARLTRAYLKSTKMVFLVTVPISLGLLVTAPLLVEVALGAKWLPMVPVWQVFCVYGLTRPVSTNASPLFLAVGKPRNNVIAGLLLIGVMIPLVVLLIEPYGIVGAAVGVSLAHIIAMLFNVYQAERILPGSGIRTILDWMPFLAAGGVMSLGIVLLQDSIMAVLGGANIISLVVVILLGALIYIAMVILLQRELVMELYELTIRALGIDRRWPRLLPEHLRTNK